MVSRAFTSALEMFSGIWGKRHVQGDQAFEQMEKSLYISNLKQHVIRVSHVDKLTNTSGTQLRLDTAFFINLVVHGRCNYL